MRTVTGYLTNIVNPNFSGIAQVHIRSEKYPKPRPEPVPSLYPYSMTDVGELTIALTEAGHGVRQLAAAFDRFSEAGQHQLATFTLDDSGMLAGVELLDEEEDEEDDFPKYCPECGRDMHRGEPHTAECSIGNGDEA